MELQTHAQAGQYAGVPYDGNDAKNVDLYHDLPKDYPAKFSWDGEGIPDSWKRHWFDRSHGGTVEAVDNSKRKEDCAAGTCVLDFERGFANAIEPNPWQADTCVGNWHYKREITYKTPKTVIDLLVDIVSRNGNMLLNFPLPGNGELDAQELAILSDIGTWMAATRPRVKRYMHS